MTSHVSSFSSNSSSFLTPWTDEETSILVSALKYTFGNNSIDSMNTEKWSSLIKHLNKNGLKKKPIRIYKAVNTLASIKPVLFKNLLGKIQIPLSEKERPFTPEYFDLTSRKRQTPQKNSDTPVKKTKNHSPNFQTIDEITNLRSVKILSDDSDDDFSDTSEEWESSNNFFSSSSNNSTPNPSKAPPAFSSLFDFNEMTQEEQKQKFLICLNSFYKGFSEGKQKCIKLAQEQLSSNNSNSISDVSTLKLTKNSSQKLKQQSYLLGYNCALTNFNRLSKEERRTPSYINSIHIPVTQQHPDLETYLLAFNNAKQKFIQELRDISIKHLKIIPPQIAVIDLDQASLLPIKEQVYHLSYNYFIQQFNIIIRDYLLEKNASNSNNIDQEASHD
jgi:hypothetical protein